MKMLLWMFLTRSCDTFDDVRTNINMYKQKYINKNIKAPKSELSETDRGKGVGSLCTAAGLPTI